MVRRKAKADAEKSFPEMVDELYALVIGSSHWGLIQGLSQTYEPHGAYFEAARRGERKNLRLWMHDLYRFNGLPYDPREIDVVRSFATPSR